MKNLDSYEQEKAARAMAREIGGHARPYGNGSFQYAYVVCSGPRHAEGRNVVTDNGWFCANVAHLAVATFPHRPAMI